MAAEIMRRMGLHSVIVVSDGYHIYRVKEMLESRGLKAYGSPRPDHNQSALHVRWNYFRQAAEGLRSYGTRVTLVALSILARMTAAPKASCNGLSSSAVNYLIQRQSVSLVPPDNQPRILASP